MMSSKSNSDTDIDIESPMTDVGEEPSTPVPTSVLSKETRKLRKKKQLDSDEESYMTQVLNQSSPLTDEQIDLLDTDDLMVHVDTPIKKSLTKKKKSTESKKSRSTKKLNIVKTDIIKKVCFTMLFLLNIDFNLYNDKSISIKK